MTIDTAEGFQKWMDEQQAELGRELAKTRSGSRKETHGPQRTREDSAVGSS